MLLGALVDAGLAFETLRAELGKLRLEGITLSAEKVQRAGLAATKVHVSTAHDHSHRSLSKIQGMIAASDLDPRVKDSSQRVFQRLGEVEALAHGIPVEQVHFHEVGALDSITDIVGSCVGLHASGIERVYCSPLNLGSGTVRAAHGTLPVPAPATARLVEGLPTYAEGPQVELTTPTGAALVATLSSEFGPPPAMRIATGGYGAGTADFPDRANVLRVLIGDAEDADSPSEQVWVLEANIDDMTPEAAGYAMERLLEAGALDVTLTPTHMKKNRPGFTMTVLAAPQNRAAMGAMMLAETSTMGVRETAARRRTLRRRWREVSTPYGPVRVKAADSGTGGETVAPEYEDCRRLAREHDVPFQRVWDHARIAYLSDSDS